MNLEDKWKKMIKKRGEQISKPKLHGRFVPYSNANLARRYAIEKSTLDKNDFLVSFVF